MTRRQWCCVNRFTPLHHAHTTFCDDLGDTGLTIRTKNVHGQEKIYKWIWCFILAVYLWPDIIACRVWECAEWCLQSLLGFTELTRQTVPETCNHWPASRMLKLWSVNRFSLFLLIFNWLMALYILCEHIIRPMYTEWKERSERRFLNSGLLINICNEYAVLYICCLCALQLVMYRHTLYLLI